MKCLSTIVALATLGIVCGCGQYNPFAHLYLTDEPDWCKVEGEYKLVWQNVTIVRDPLEHVEAPTIRLMLNGRFESTGFPTWKANTGLQWEKAQSKVVVGSWSKTNPGVVSDGETSEWYWGISFDPHPAEAKGSMPALNDSGNRAFAEWYFHPGSPALAREDGILKLIFVYGDGDNGIGMVYEQQEDNSQQPS